MGKNVAELVKQKEHKKDKNIKEMIRKFEEKKKTESEAIYGECEAWRRSEKLSNHEDELRTRFNTETCPLQSNTKKISGWLKSLFRLQK